MSLFISKKAITHIPISDIILNIQQERNPPLKSNLLKDVEYLIQLNDGLPIKSLSVNNNSESTYEAVNRIKLALIAIDKLNIFSFEIPEEIILELDGYFDENTRNAVQLFQNFSGIPETGEVDTFTLSTIDKYLGDISFIANNTNLIGVATNKSIDITEDVISSPSSISYNYHLTSEGNIYLFSTELPLTVYPYKAFDENSNSLFVKLDSGMNEEFKQQNNIISHSNEFYELNFEKIRLKDKPNISLNQSIITSEMENIPKSILSSDKETLYLIKQEDTPISIINSHYYNQSEDIINPFTGETIFTLPAREMSPVGLRDQDARLKFYLNLLYYYNSEEIINQNTGEILNIKEYGIKSNSSNYVRYNNEDLNNYFMFDNKFDLLDENTVKPNYYRFLEDQTTGTILFSADGQPITFNFEQGKFIRIPSRQFADSLYYHLNFRHNEMLTDALSYVISSGLETIIQQMQYTNVWQAFGEWLSNEITELYQETLEFFKSVYEYAMNLTDFIPRGLGAQIGGDIGITWGYPIATDFSLKKQLWRKMTPQDELTFIFREYGSSAIGVDAAWGVSCGFKIGSGKSKKTAAVAAVAGAEANVEAETTMDYEFPIREEETALLTMVLNMFDSSGVISNFLGSIHIINVDPRNYLIMQKLGFTINGKAYANAQFGAVTSNIKQITHTTYNSAANDEQNRKSFLNIENIWNKIPGLGIGVEGSVSLGYEFTYQAEYENKPLFPEKDSRVPSGIKTENEYFLGVGFNYTPMGSFLQRFFLNIGIENLASIFEFNKGVAIKTTNEFKRLGEAKNITLNEVDVSNINQTQAGNITSDNGKLSIRNGQWTRLISFGFFTGDVDKLCEPGTESYLNLNTHKIYSIGSSGTPLNFSLLADVLEIFYSYSYRYKTGFGYKGHQRKKIADSVFETLSKTQSALDNSIERGVKRKFMENANSNIFALDTYAGLDLNVEFLINDTVRKVLTYFFKKIYLIYKYKSSTPQNTADYNKLITLINKKRIEITNSLPLGTIEDVNYFDILYTELENFLNTTVPFNVDLQGADFSPSYKVYASIYMQFSDFLQKTCTLSNKINPSDYISNIGTVANKIWEDIGTIDILKAIIFATQIAQLKATLEAKLGINLSVNFKAGIGATIRLAFNATEGLLDQTEFMKDGMFIDLDPQDPYYLWFQKFKDIFNTDLNKKPDDGIRKSFITT